MNYKLLFSKDAIKDAKKLKSAHLNIKCKMLIEILKNDLYTQIPPYERLIGDLSGFYSRRINIQHRLIYSINEEEKIIKILRMWTHYE